MRGAAESITYNQMATDLENVNGWWQAQSPDDQADPTNLDKDDDCPVPSVQVAGHLAAAVAPPQGWLDLRADRHHGRTARMEATA